MIQKLIELSLRNRLIVLLLAAGLFAWGIYAVEQNPIDAIPDLSENQVIVFTEWMGRSPQIIEDQVTYPLVSNLQGIPKVKNIRGTSMFGMSFVYIIFDDDVDVYWARTRVLERLSYAQRLLPPEVTPSLGPDGTGVGHVFWYTLEAKQMDLGEQRALQDWYVKLALQTVPGVAEVASFGGFEKQYQLVIDPVKLQFYNVAMMDVMNKVRTGNNDVGGRKFEIGDMAYIIRGLGYVKNKTDLENIAVGNYKGIPVRVKDIATVQMGGDLRLGIFDENGEGEVVGGIVVMRYGENADKVIRNVRKKMADVQRGLPEGVTFKVAYDRSELIRAAIGNVKDKLIEEMIVVSFIVILFLLHWRSALSIIIQIPVTIAASFILLNAFGLSSNIMSLTGIALAIGVIVDNGIIMSENAYRNLSEWQNNSPYPRIPEAERMAIILRSCKQVSRGVFFSTVIIIASFLPVFLLTGQEGKLFHPLAYTKTFILVVDAVLVITLAPVLISFFMKGRFRPESANPINRVLERIYEPVIRACTKWRKTTIGINILALLISIPLLLSLGREFMPPLDEGSLLFMPVTLPDVSNAEAKRLLQVQDKIIKSMPEVDNVLGKAGRANTATDNSPISMIETIVLLKPKAGWRAGVTKDSIIRELNEKLQIPGVTNGWTQPIINRINMLSTGIRTDVGVKIYGQDLDSINAFAQAIRNALNGIPGVKDLYVDPITGGKYLDITVKREEIGRYGLSIEDVNSIIESALGGMKLTTTVEGRQRFSVSARFGQDFRNNLQSLKRLQVPTMNFGPIPLEAVADLKITEGPPMINSENASLRGTVLFNVRNRDLAGTVKEAQEKLDKLLTRLPKGYYIEWSGQYENLIRSQRTLKMILPVVLLIIFIAMYFAFHSAREAFFSLISIPFALIGGAFMVYFWGVNLSVAVAIGFIALFGLAVETGIVMVIYLNDAMRQLVDKKGNSKETITREELREYVIAGAARRLRPKLMTVSVSLFALIPILWSSGVGSDVMKPIVLPMVGGVITSATHILLVTPLIFLMTKEYELRKYGKITTLLFIGLLTSWTIHAQPAVGLDSIYSGILRGNPSLRSSDAQIRSLDEAAKGARNWEAPQISTGLWMTPYNPNLWKRQADGASGIGQYMISAEQMLPNKRRLDAEEAYMQGMSSVVKERRMATLNELYAGAKQNYYQWMMIKRKLKVLDQDEQLLDFMIKDAELRYRNNLGKISAYYKAKAALGNVESMRLGLENDIVQKRVMLNTLMNRDKSIFFDIDTAYVMKDLSSFPVDSALLLDARSDIKAVGQDIRLIGLQQRAERMKLKPEFGVRFDHMFGFGGVPMQYSLMGMVRLPMFGWSSRAIKANVESLKWKAESLNQERERMVNEAEGMSYGLQQEILSRRKQLQVLETKVIPALQKNFQTMQLAYEQNTEELFNLYDAWETLNSTQMNYWDQVQQLLLMQVELERILEIK